MPLKSSMSLNKEHVWMNWKYYQGQKQGSSSTISLAVKHKGI